MIAYLMLSEIFNSLFPPFACTKPCILGLFAMPFPLLLTRSYFKACIGRLLPQQFSNLLLLKKQHPGIYNSPPRSDVISKQLFRIPQLSEAHLGPFVPQGAQANAVEAAINEIGENSDVTFSLTYADAT